MNCEPDSLQGIGITIQTLWSLVIELLVKQKSATKGAQLL